MSPFDLALATLAAVLAGLVNALAGGGTLISFPVLLALGVPPLAANITNAVALCPGYLGATLAQLRNLAGQRQRLLVLAPVSLIGGIAGAALLIRTGERTFTTLIPWMLLFASLLLALQDTVRAFVVKHIGASTQSSSQRAAAPLLTVLAVGLASAYGGFFSAGMSVLLIAVLGLTLTDTFTRLNALKQILAFNVNIAAAIYFMWSEHVIWPAAAAMALGALIGGALGGRLASRISPTALRWGVVSAGIGIAIVYWLK